MRPINFYTETEEFVIMPACCIHWPIGDKALIKEWVSEVERTPNALTFLMGDAMDGVRTHYRDHIRSYRADANSQELLDTLARQSADELIEILKPISHKIIGTIKGNHTWEFSDGRISDQYIAEQLDIYYLGAMAAVRLITPGDRSMTLFAHHHGGGGGMTIGGDANALLKQEAAWDVDMYLAGHTHKRLAFKLPQMTISDENEPRVLERTKVFVRCGAFLRSFKEDFPTVDRQHLPSYAEEKALRPTDLGWVSIDVKWKTDGRPDFKVSY